MTRKPQQNQLFIWKDAQELIARRFSGAYGWDMERSQQAAEIAAEALRKSFGGKKYYIPGGNSHHRERVREEFNGRNFAHLSQKYGLSIATIRRYVVDNKEFLK